MKASTWLKLAMLAVLALCSSAATSTILTWRRLKGDALDSRPPLRRASDDAAPQDQMKIGGRVRVDKKGAGAAEVKRELDEGGSVKTHFSLGGVLVQDIGGGIIVSCDATISSLEERFKYIWSLEVLDYETRNPVFNKVYHKEAFDMGGRKTIRPTFSDAVELESGKYLVKVRLLDIHPGFDLDKLTDDRVVANKSVLIGVRTVTVTD